MEVIYFLLLLSSQLCFGTHCSCFSWEVQGLRAITGFCHRAAKTVFSPALLKSPGTLALSACACGMQPAPLCGISSTMGSPGGARELNTRACDSHWATQPAGGLMWFGKQIKENVLKCFEALSGNWRKQSRVLFILASQKDFYKNLKAMYNSGELLFSFLLLCGFLCLTLPYHHANIQRKREK